MVRTGVRLGTEEDIPKAGNAQNHGTDYEQILKSVFLKIRHIVNTLTMITTAVSPLQMFSQPAKTQVNLFTRDGRLRRGVIISATMTPANCLCLFSKRLPERAQQHNFIVQFTASFRSFIKLRITRNIIHSIIAAQATVIVVRNQIESSNC